MTEAQTPTPLLAPRDGLPTLVESDSALQMAAQQLSAGQGPIAVDTERASGYRYSQRAYLLQFRRRESGTVLVDPIEIEDLQPLREALANDQWIIHSALQDLGCLHELGLRPHSLFDTEHAAKLLGKPRVGLSALLESELGISLAKEHSAADWSTRPLPEDWLNYAALDVELLIELRDLLEQQLIEAGRLEWALQDFNFLNQWRAPEPDPEPWRRTSGIHRVHKLRELAVVRELWVARDELARSKDKAPGRLLPDAAIVDIAKLASPTAANIRRLATLRNRGHKALAEHWEPVVARALALPETELPTPTPKSNGYPPPKAWSERFPEAAARWERIRPALNHLAEEIGVAAEVLIQPELIRRLCWQPATALDSAEELAAWLSSQGARPWQIELCTPVMIHSLVQEPPAKTESSSD